jgi:Flp pilus assembly protein TadG
VALAELAAVLPVLVLLLMAVVDVGRMFVMSIAMASAARAGVQYGAQNSATAADYDGMKDAALNDANGVTGISAAASSYCKCSNGAAVDCKGSCPSGGPIKYVEVDTTGTFTTLLTYPGLPSSIPLHSSAVMRES